MYRNIVISTKTVFITLLFVVGGLLLYQIQDIVLQLLIAFIVALAIEPGVKYMIKKRIPRWVAVGIVFGTTIFVIVGFFTVALPVVISQTRVLIANIPFLIDSVIKSPELKASLSSSLSELTIASGGIVSFTVGFFSNTLSALTLFVFTLYLSLDLPNVKKRFIDLFSEKHKDYVEEAWREIEVNLSRWIRGQLFLMIAVGLTAYVGLIILKVPFALPLAIISGVLEVVPVLGPIVATIIAGLVGFAVSPLMGVLVLALFIGIQQLENSFLVPRIMQKIIGFNPLVTMIALLVGAKLFGVVGAIIAVPVALILIVIVHSIVSLELDDTGVE